MAKTGEQFLHTKDTSLHHSQEVEGVISYLRTGGEKIPNEPAQKLEAYLAFLASKEYVNDGVVTGETESIARQVEACVINEHDIPQSYYDLQRRIAREQGHGDIDITEDMKHQLAEALQTDQRASLTKWVEYINGPDGSYPQWFEFYVWESLQKLGRFDKEKGEFTKRDSSTVAPYPELNRAALAYVYNKLTKSLEGDITSESEQMQKLLKGGNFGKLYAKALIEATTAKEIIKTTEGSWKKYDQTDDPRTARRLSESLAGYGLEWCTVGEATAAKQLKGGDFYVYYTRDEDDKDTNPRVAIRIENGQVAEVRGTLDRQELEPDFYDIVQEKLADLPGGSEYTQKADDMKRLTLLEALVRNDPYSLSADDLRFIYEIDHKVEGFGYYEDPRLEDIIMLRYFTADMQEIFGTTDSQELADKLFDAGKVNLIVEHFDRFNNLDATFADKLIDIGLGSDVACSLDSFTSLDHTAIANKLIEAGYSNTLMKNLDKSTDLDHNDIANKIIDIGLGAYVASYLDKFNNLDASIADKLIDIGQGSEVVYNLNSFTGLDHTTIADKLIDIGQGTYVAANLDKFNNLDAFIADKLIDNQRGYTVAKYLYKFTGLDHTAIANKLISINLGYSVASNLDNFTGLDHHFSAEIASLYGKA